MDGYRQSGFFKAVVGLAALVVVVLCFADGAEAGSSWSFGIGYGYHSGHRYSGHFGYHRGYYGYPYWGGWCGPRHYYYDHWYSPVVVERPVVIERRPVIVEKEVVVEPKQDELYAELRVKKGELIKKVRLGDKQQRMAAITELAGFSFDLKVRLALENVARSNPDAELRIAAVRAFASVRNKDALPFLKKVRVTDPSETVRAEIDEAIATIEGR